MNSRQGFTLIELLLGLFVSGILMLALTQLFTGSLSASSALNSRNDLINEVQLAQQVIAGRTTDAIYVYPNSASLTLSNGNTTKFTMTGTNSQTWPSNSTQILAMVLPPSNSAADCTSAITDGCYRFFAYYTMKRSYLVGLSATSDNGVLVDVPDADAINSNQWVIMEYRRNLLTSAGTVWTPAVGLPPAATFYTGGAGKILADYVEPNSNNVGFTVTPPTTAQPGSVAIELTAERYRLGSASANSSSVCGGAATTGVICVGPQTVVVYPRNWSP